ncbi:uncharacterized protein LOC122082689 [Macadamia integrifolia]|uniref:uncharacterized protein LOC122082689 n=1 Tax=Macadamia integrifolia TaxID=60698 RepID=UPI001C4FFB56|nr:uncharacterized protein LOC122082689 [Macadamia integrifolia]
MMNLMALFLVLSSLTTASIWSTPPETLETVKKKAREDVIVREGRRLIVVEYEKEIPLHPKVLIPPQEAESEPESDLTHKLTGQTAGEKLSEVTMAAKEKANEATSDQKVGDKLSDATMAGKEKAKEATSDQGVGEKLSEVAMAAKEKAKEAASVLPNLGQGLSTSTQSQPPPGYAHRATPREQICDAFGKCKLKLAGVLGKAKDKAQEEAEQVKEKAKDVIGATKRAGENLTEKVKQAEEKADDVVDRAKAKTHHLEREAKENDNLTDIIRRGREVAHDALTYMVSTEKWAALMGVIQLLGFANAYGTCVWVTFVSSYVLAGALPRQQFGIVQSKIYPVYFKTMAYSIGLSLVGLWLNPGSRRSESVQGFNLLTSLAMVLVNLLYLEPRATKVMFERMKVDKEEGRGRDDADIVMDTPQRSQMGISSGTATTTTTTTSGAATESEKGGGRTSREEEKSKKVKSRLGLLNQRLKKLNTQSSFLNVLTLMNLTWHLVELGQRLHLSC